MGVSLERYYSALLAQGRANAPTIGEAKRDLERDWLQLAASGGTLRI